MQRLGWQARLVCASGLLSACAAGDRTGAARSPTTGSSQTAGTAGGVAKQGVGTAGTLIPGATSPSDGPGSGVGADAGGSGLPPPPSAGGTAAGTFKPRADLDPNAKFDWEETSPGSAANDCQAGVYGGTFDCTFVPDPMMFGDGVGTIDVSGPISLTLVQSMNGEFLEISDGNLDAVAQLFFGFHAKLDGQLDCKSDQLKATAADGMWALGDPSMPIVPGGTFGADISGMLDPQAKQLTGQWAFTTGTIPGTCTGTWSAMYMP